MAQLARAKDRCVRCAWAAGRAWAAGGASEALSLREHGAAPRCTSNLEVICFEAYANAMKQRLYRFEPYANVMKDMSKHPLYIESFL